MRWLVKTPASSHEARRRHCGGLRLLTGGSPVELDPKRYRCQTRAESRNGDPQLHDHLVVQGADGKCRTIDSKLLHRMNVPISEFYNAAIMSEVTKALDVTTEARTVSAGKRPVMEIAGVDTDLIDTFSSRSAWIRDQVGRLTADYQRDHGRAPDTKAQIKPSFASGRTAPTKCSRTPAAARQRNQVVLHSSLRKRFSTCGALLPSRYGEWTLALRYRRAPAMPDQAF